jgi:tubulin-specific chaperone A
MTAVMKTTPWGFILSAISAVYVAYQMFSDQADKLTATQKVLNDVHLEATKNIAKEKAELDLLVKIANSENATKEQKEKALKRLNALIPDYIGKLTLENLKTAEGIGILKEYTNELYRNARAKAVQAKFEELAQKRLDVENKSGKEYTSKTGNFLAKITGQDTSLEFKSRKEVEQYVLKTFASQLNVRKDKTTGATLVDKELFRTLVDKYVEVYGVGKKEAELSEIDAAMKVLQKEMEANMVKDLTKPEDTDKKPDLSFIDEEKKKKEKKYNDSYLDQERRLMEEVYQAWKKNQEDRIAQMKEGYEKEMALENLKHSDILHSNEAANAAIVALEKKLDKELIEAKKAGDKPKIESINNMKKLLVNKKKELDQSIEHEEKLHKLRIATIQEKAAKSEIEKINEKYEHEKLARETAFLDQLNASNISEEAKERKRKKFDKQELEYEKQHLAEIVEIYKKAISEQSIKGIDFNLLDDEQKDKLAQDLEKVLNAIQKINQAKKKDGKESKEIDLGLGGGTDILGFTQQQWDKFFDNINNGTIGLQTMQFAVGAVQQLWGQFDQYLASSEQNQLKSYEKNADRKKKALKQQLDSGMISQAQYKKGVEALDRELDEAKAEIDYKAAKRQKITAAINVAMSTAQAIMSIWAQVPKFDFGASAGIMTGIVSALGALQLATILATPLPAKGYEKGLYPEYVKRQQDGKTFKASYGGKTKSGIVNNPTYFLTGENGPEMIIDSAAYRKLNPQLREMLINELNGIPGFESGYYKNGVLYSGNNPTTTPDKSNTSSNDTELLQMMFNVIAENTEVMRDIRDNGLTAIVTTKDMRSMKELSEGLKKIKENKDKARIS